MTGCEARPSPGSVGARPTTGIAGCDDVRATAGAVGGKPIIVCAPELVDARTDGMFDCVGARPDTGSSAFAAGVGVRPANDVRSPAAGARSTAVDGNPIVCGVRPTTGISTFDCCDAVRATTGAADRPIIVCAPEFVDARTDGMFDCVGARPTTGSTSDCCDAVRATTGAAGRPIIVCAPEFVGARTDGMFDCVGARPTTGSSTFAWGVGVRPLDPRLDCDDARSTAVDDRPIIVCAPEFVEARTDGMLDCVGARPTTGSSTFDCCDTVRATSEPDRVGARPTTDGMVDCDGARGTTGCEPVCVGVRPTIGSMFDRVDARPIAGAPIIVCDPDCVGARPTDSVTARFVIARGNGGGTDDGRTVAARPSIELAAGGVVPEAVRRGIGGGSDGRTNASEFSSTGWVCSSFAIASARDAPDEPGFSLWIRELEDGLSREAG